MKVVIIMRIDGREVAVIKQEVFGEALKHEERTVRLKDQVGQAVLEERFADLAASL